jgi:hypothetical protein
MRPHILKRLYVKEPVDRVLQSGVYCYLVLMIYIFLHFLFTQIKRYTWKLLFTHRPFQINYPIILQFE